MELVDRYIYAVTRNMGADQRQDVADELRGLIEDALDEKGSRSKQSIREVLLSFGDPEFLAQRYKGSRQYLIGPDLFGIYIRALKMTFSIGIPVALIIVAIDQIIKQPESIISFALAVCSGLIGIIIQMLFWVTLVFFILDRTNVQAKDLTENHPWDPSMLPEATAKRQIPLYEAVSDIVWYSLLIALPFIANTFVGAHIDGQTTPLFNPQLSNVWLFIIVALGGIGLTKSLLKLRLHCWPKSLAIFNVLFALTFSTTLILLVTTTQLINPAFASVLDSYINTANLAQVTDGINWTVGITTAVIVGSYLYDAVNSIRLSRNSLR